MQLQTTWGWLVAVYFFFGGLGAGAFCMVALIALISGERFKATIRFGAWASSIVIAVGTLALLADVGVPLRAIVMFNSFVHLDSWMTRGAWLLFFAILLNGFFALLWTDAVLTRVARIWKPLFEYRAVLRVIVAVVGLAVNIGVAVYTGILLNVLQFRPFWNTNLLPALFTVSAMDTGLGLVTAYATLRERAEGVGRLRNILEAFVIVLICAEGAVLAYYLQVMLGGAVDAVRSAKLLMDGILSPAFWGLVVGLGLAVPLLICVIQLSGLGKRIPVTFTPWIAVTSCLIGGFTLRMVVLMAGLPQALSSPSLLQILAGVRFSP